MKQRQFRVIWRWSISFVVDGAEGVDQPLKSKRFNSFDKAKAFIEWLMDTDSEDCPKLNGKWVHYGENEDYYEGTPAPKPDFAYIETRLVEYPKWEITK